MSTFLLEKFARSASLIIWLGRGVFFSVLVLLLVMRSLVTVIRVDGRSMDPTLHDGQWLVVDLVTKRVQPWRFDDVVILRFPGDPLHTMYVKRIIGLPNDQISLQEGAVIRNGQKILEPYLSAETTTEPGIAEIPKVIPAGQYFVLGDNRSISNDSRYFGLVQAQDLVGRVVYY